MMQQFLPYLILWVLIYACKEPQFIIPTDAEFGNKINVEIIDYDKDIMEAFLSRDGKLLFFNNSNAAGENTNLHYAQFVNDSTFQYLGELKNVNTKDLEGVASMDALDNFYFTSSRNYDVTFSTLYTGIIKNGELHNIHLLEGNISVKKAPFVNMDSEISDSGQHLYFTTNELNPRTGVPKTSDIQIAKKNENQFEKLPNSSAIMKNINTDKLEYAPCTSSDELTLYFTRTDMKTANFKIMVAHRSSVEAAFGVPKILIESIGMVTEAPTISPDGKTLYFHAHKNGKYRLFKISKK